MIYGPIKCLNLVSKISSTIRKNKRHTSDTYLDFVSRVPTSQISYLRVDIIIISIFATPCQRSLTSLFTATCYISLADPQFIVVWMSRKYCFLGNESLVLQKKILLLSTYPSKIITLIRDNFSLLFFQHYFQLCFVFLFHGPRLTSIS